jgi:hypothetical protein
MTASQELKLSLCHTLIPLSFLFISWLYMFLTSYSPTWAWLHLFRWSTHKEEFPPYWWAPCRFYTVSEYFSPATLTFSRLNSRSSAHMDNWYFKMDYLLASKRNCFHISESTIVPIMTVEKNDLKEVWFFNSRFLLDIHLNIWMVYEGTSLLTKME